MTKHKRDSRQSTIERFEALPDAEKNRIVREIEAETPQQRLARSRPLNARERAQWRRFKKKAGRPKIGSGTKNISISIERDLLHKADRFAKRHGMSRSQLIAQGLMSVIGFAA